MDFAMNGIDWHQYNANFKPDPFPVKFGDEVIVKDPYAEIETTVKDIIDRGEGWVVLFDGLPFELSLKHYGTTFRKKDGMNVA